MKNHHPISRLYEAFRCKAYCSCLPPQINPGFTAAAFHHLINPGLQQLCLLEFCAGSYGSCLQSQPLPQRDCNLGSALPSTKFSGEKKKSFVFATGTVHCVHLIILPLQQKIWFLSSESQRILNIFIFPSTLDSSSLQLLPGECHSNSSYLTIYSPFLLHYPKWNRLAITEPTHAILYSLQFPTSHLKKQILHCYLKIY